MVTDFQIYLNNRPGELSKIAEALGKQGINIDGISGMSQKDDQAEIHLTTNDADSTQALFDSLGIRYTKNEALLLNLKDDPGSLAAFTKALSEAEVNLTAFYITMNSQQVMTADNLAQAKEIAENHGVI